MPALSIAEQLLYSTVKLTASVGGNVLSYGTGFFIRLVIDNDHSAPIIVTNKHVVANCDRITAMLHLSNGNEPAGTFAPAHIGIGPNVIHHPDPTVDLCAIPIADILIQAENAGTPIFLRYLDLGLIPTDDDWQYFDAIEDVTMIGCPNGISDEVNNLPIIRQGITATPLSKKYNGKPEFMVDMACFPGSSGSPIFIYDRNGYLDRKTNSNMIGASRLHLVGVLYAGPLITNNGQVILAVPPQISINTMMHLGYAIRASEIRTLDALIRSLATF